MALIHGKHNGRSVFFFASGEGGKEAAAKALARCADDTAAAQADALLPAFLAALGEEPARAFAGVDGALALHLQRHEAFISDDIGAGDIQIDGVLALAAPTVARGLALGGRRSALNSPGFADHVFVAARTAEAAAEAAHEISAAVPETHTFEAEETWNALSAGARAVGALRDAGRIYGAAITHKGRGRVLGALDPNPLFRLRVSDWR